LLGEDEHEEEFDEGAHDTAVDVDWRQLAGQF
jgi:hypothetical protein